MIVAIDGPAGSGKSSTAREVARRLGFLHLDSGAFYRGVTRAMLDAGLDPEGAARLDSAAIDELDVTSRIDPADGVRILIHGAEVEAGLRAADVNAHVSAVARSPAVRDWVNARLRAIARTTDVVTDGRDIGTVVFADADLKVYLTATAETRARRRLLERGETATAGAVAAEAERIERRDRLDSERTLAPLRKAGDAVVVDTTDLDFETQVERVVALTRARAGSGPARA